MTEIYFDIETGYEDSCLIERLKNGLRVDFDINKEKCKIITIQYQLLDRNGMPAGPLRIFKEWESSEKEIIQKIFNMLNPRRLWEFVPVGYNIYFDLGFFKERAKIYGMEYDEWFIYHRLPTIDIKHICLGMNAFIFKNSGLDKFTGKETDGSVVPVWYHQKEYDKIIDYIQKETAEFIKFYSKLKQVMPQFRRQHGFF